MFSNNKEVVSDQIQIDAFVSEAYAETYIKQVFFNSNSNSVELSVELPNKKGVQFIDFEVEIKDKKVKSKLITKEKAEEKYSDAISQGNTGIYCEYNKEYDIYIIHLGNIEPNTKVYFKSHFLQSLISHDLNYFFRLMDHFPFPKFNNRLDNNNYNFYNYYESPGQMTENYNIKIHFQTSSPITISEQNIEANSLTIRNRFNEDKTKYEIEIYFKAKKQEIINSNSLYGSNFINKPILVSFEFQIEDYKKPKLYKQYNPINDETTYLLSYFKTIIDEDDNSNNQISQSFPGLYYFIIDQSGSMSGRPIKLVIQTLKVFLLSLPKGSYFQLIGFGTDFKPYSDYPLSYTKDNVNKTILEIEKLGNMGGTNLFDPLEYVYNNLKSNENLHLPQHIFILTDGYTEQKQKVLDIIENNNNNCQVYPYGIGNDFDQDFIRTAGECGHGSYKFINDIENLNGVINEQLKKCMRAYYSKVKFTVEKNNNNEIIYDFYRNEFILENQLVNYSFIMKGKTCGNISIKCNYNDFNEIFNFDENKILNLKDGDILSKITIHSLIQKGEGDNFSQEEKIKKIAKKYQILCQYTSLYAEIENSDKILNPNLQKIQIISSNTNNNKGGGTLFGNINPYSNNGLFGNNSIFGNNKLNLFAPYGSSSANHNPLFGNNTQQQQQNLFVYNNNPYGPSSASQSSIFGNNYNNLNNSSNNTNYKSTGFFNYNNINNNQSNNLLNNNNSQSNSLFNNNNKQSNSIFNNIGIFGNNNAQKINDEKNHFRAEICKDEKKEKSNIFFSFSDINESNNNQMNINNVENNIDNPDKILENIVLNLDIINECWEENNITKYVLDLKKSIYENVKNIVENNNIATTFVILFYILNDRKEKINEYLNIINKAKRFLFNNGFSYEFILSKIQIN